MIKLYTDVYINKFEHHYLFKEYHSDYTTTGFNDLLTFSLICVDFRLVFRISLRKAPKFKSHRTMQKAQQDAKCHDQDPAATTRHSLTQPMVLQMAAGAPCNMRRKGCLHDWQNLLTDLGGSGWHLYLTPAKFLMQQIHAPQNIDMMQQNIANMYKHV